MMLALYIVSKHHSTTTTFSRNSWLFWLFLLIRNIVHLPPIQLKDGSCTMFPFLHENVGNIGQLPLFDLKIPWMQESKMKARVSRFWSNLNNDHWRRRKW